MKTEAPEPSTNELSINNLGKHISFYYSLSSSPSLWKTRCRRCQGRNFRTNPVPVYNETGHSVVSVDRRGRRTSLERSTLTLVLSECTSYPRKETLRPFVEVGPKNKKTVSLTRYLSTHKNPWSESGGTQSLRVEIFLPENILIKTRRSTRK